MKSSRRNPASPDQYHRYLRNALEFLRRKQRILFLCTSNRWIGEKSGDTPKSTQLAYYMASALHGKKVTVLDIPRLNIFPCEGNVSTARGNTCGQLKAALQDKIKNPTGQHRCWASINNPDDELWQVSKALLASDCVVFFGSVRWGQMNSFYQKLIERLTWLENRHSSLGESNLLAKTAAGIIAVGQNWHGAKIVETQKQVLGFYGFDVVDALCWNWQYTKNLHDEREDSYEKSDAAFRKAFFS